MQRAIEEDARPAGCSSSSCSLDNCLCRWRKTVMPRVAPASKEFICIPAGAVHHPVWSVLVGVMETSKLDSSSSLRLHRFRVASSGRVLGRSGEALEIFVDQVPYKEEHLTSSIRASIATQMPDSRVLSLSLFSREFDASKLNSGGRQIKAPRPLQLDLDVVAGDDRSRVKVTTLPQLSLRTPKPTCPISVNHVLWAPYLTTTSVRSTTELVMQFLNKDDGSWAEVDRLTVPNKIGQSCRSTTRVFQGYAVVGHTILVSLYPSHFFFAFDCRTRKWAPVLTREEEEGRYISIHDRSLYVKEHDTIYFLHDASVYAYKLHFPNQFNQQHSMDPPTKVDSISPFPNQGNSFLAYLGGRIMCSVWVSVRFHCGCDTKHVLITTFRVNGHGGSDRHFVPDGLEILHSTCRRIELSPTKPHESYDSLCILQEYKELHRKDGKPPSKKKKDNVMAPSMPLKVQAASDVMPTSKMIACCRKFFNGTPFSYAVALEPSVIQTNKTLFIVCQAPSYSTVYKIDISDGRFICLDKILRPHCKLEIFASYNEDDMMERGLPWHFVCDGKYIYAAPAARNEVYACSLQEANLLHHFTSPRPTVAFQLVLRVGAITLALSDNLQYLYEMSDPGCFVQHETSVPHPYLEQKVDLSGYVVLGATSFMVFDAKSDCCLFFDLQDYKWSIVKPYETHPWPQRVFLSERSLFAEGFIYTCSDGGLIAYELSKRDDSYYLGNGINLEFAWGKHWMRDRMRFEYVGKDASLGVIMFCVLQDDNVYRPRYPDNLWSVGTTTIQVKTERMPSGSLKPKIVGHVHICKFSVDCGGSGLWTRNVFAADPL